MSSSALFEYYRCPHEFLSSQAVAPSQGSHGYFGFGPDLHCYGQTSKDTSLTLNDALFEVSTQVRSEQSSVVLPFDPTQVLDNLRYERYVKHTGRHRWLESLGAKKSYYWLRPLLPVLIRRYFQQIYLRGWERLTFPAWPVDRSVDRLCETLLRLTMQTQHREPVPFIWFWPEGHTACAIVTHDVEAPSGRDFTERLMDIDDAYGIKASFQIVPEQRYPVSPAYLEAMRARGFEINVQGLNHDGRLFWEYEEFLRRARKINHYAKEWGAQGFRSPVLYRNIDWFQHLEFAYDMSIPTVARLDPQRGGCCTVMPYFLPSGMLELPVTMIQDYSLFHILKNYSLSLWAQQIKIILEGHGLMNFIVHPDYLLEERALGVYQALLDSLVQLRAERGVWIALPGEVNRWWRERSAMQLVADGPGWRIEGAGSERARVAYARVDGERLVYELAPPHKESL